MELGHWPEVEGALRLLSVTGAVFPQHEVVATARTAEGNVGTRSVRQQNSEICKHFKDYFHSLCVLFCFSFAFAGRRKSVR